MFALGVTLLPGGEPERAAAPAGGGPSPSRGADAAREGAARTPGEASPAEALPVCQAPASAPESEPRSGPERVEVVVRFSHNGVQFTAEEATELRKFAEEAVAAGASWVRVEGYGDATGTDEANLRVSQERSERVAEYLRDVLPAAGMEFTTVGRGAGRPVADNGTEEGRARNRRVEVVAGVE